MLKVHVWTPHDGMVGHASISYGNNYVSFWPEDRAVKKDLKTKAAHPSQLMSSLDDDIVAEGKRIRTTVLISSYDAKKLEDFIFEFRKNKPKYQLAKYNCSHVVADCLKAACGKDPDFVPRSLSD